MQADTTNPVKTIWAGIAICLITVFVHLAGSAVFFGLVSGPLAILFSPLLSIFGWFFLLPEFIGVALQWLAYAPDKGRKRFWTVMFVSVALAVGFLSLWGFSEEGNEILWRVAFMAAAATSATASLVAIHIVKRLMLDGAVPQTNHPNKSP